MDVEVKQINITHFINPYQFWYYNTDEESYLRVQETEEALNNFYQDHFNGTSQAFQLDIQIEKKIAVKYLPRNKYIRVRVEDIVRKRHETTYIVWALDHGFPFETKPENCLCLPEKLDQSIDRIRYGGIEGIVPAEKENNLIQQPTVTVFKERWSARACDCLGKFIADAVSVEFIEICNLNGQNWGDLLIQSHNSQVHHASDYLINENFAVYNFQKFKQLCSKIKIPVWQTNDGNNKIHKNTAPFVYNNFFDERQRSINSSVIQNAICKVDAWANFNKRVAKNMGTTDSFADNSNDTLTLYDLNIDDSVSPDDTQITQDVILNEDEDIYDVSNNKSSSVANSSDFERTEVELVDVGAEMIALKSEDDCGVVTMQTQSNSHLQMVKRSKQISAYLDHAGDEYVGAETIALKSDDECRVVNLQTQSNSRLQYLSEMRRKSKQKFANKQSPEESNTISSFSTDNTNQNSNISMSSLRSQQLCILRKKSEALRAKRKAEEHLESNKEATKEQTKIRMLPTDHNFAILDKNKKTDKCHHQETKRNEKQYLHDKLSDYLKSDYQNPERSEKNNEDQINTENIEESESVHSTMPLVNKTNHCQREKTKRNEKNLHDNLSDFTKSNNEYQERSETQTFEKSEDHINSGNIEESSLPQNSINPQKDITVNIENTNNSTFLDALDSDDDSISNASSQISMYSAVSYLEEDVVCLTTVHTTKTPTAITQKHCTTNDSNQLLEDFIIKSDNLTKDKLTEKQASLKDSLFLGKTREGSHGLLNGDVKLRMKYLEHTVLAHSQSPLNTTESFNKTLLAPIVRKGMQNKCITNVYRTQSYAWPHIMQGNSVFIVNRPDSGKTWSYIPALCTAITKCIENQFLPDTYGPLAIVIVASAKRVVEVANNCDSLLDQLEKKNIKTVGSYGVRMFARTKILLMETCGILVVTPPTLCRLLKDNERKDPLFDPLRLQHIIIDDIDVMLARCKNDLTLAFKTLYALVPKENKKIVPQLVVTSRFYLPLIEKLISISKQPLLIIGDFLEAAVYGKAKISIEICSKEQKLQRILNFIKEHPFKKESLMILCNSDDDVFFVGEGLISAGIDCLGYHSKSTTLARDRVYQWKNQANIHSKVLVCCDSVLAELEIQNVQNLLHYSLADSWTKFKLRFSVHIKMYENIVLSSSSELYSSSLPEQRVTSLVLLDEENNMELPRVVEFLKYHNQLKNIHPQVVNLSERITMQREIERRTENHKICNLLFEYGNCDEQACLKRHTLIKEDVDINESKEPLLQSGDLRILVLNVFSPTHYSVRLLEHRATSTSDWHIIRQSDRVALFVMNFNFFYNQSNNLRKHWPININDICVYEKGETFHRVRVIKVETLASHNIIKTLEVTIHLIDSGDILCENSDRLYVCDEKFKDFPAQAIDVRLIGLLPFDNERNWDADTTKYVKGILTDNLKKNECVHANISCSLVDTIFLREIVVMEKLPTLSNYIYRIHLRRHLVENNYGLIDTHAEERIYNIIKKHGLEKLLKKMKEEEVSKIEAEKQDVQQPKQKQKTKSRNDTEHSLSKAHNAKSININKSNCDANTSDSSNTKTFQNDLKKENMTDNQALQSQSTTENVEKTLNSNEEKPEIPSSSVKCSVLDFLQALQIDNQLNAEDCDLYNENVPDEFRNFFRETDLMCKQAIMYELERQNGGNAQQKKAIMEKAPKIVSSRSSLSKTKKILFENLEPLKKEETKEIKQEQQLAFIQKRLKELHMRPETLWYETDHLIILCIKAPDIVDYYLEVGATYLYFMAKVNEVKQVLVLNFLGTIKPQYVSHEIRGLNVIVRLVKGVFMRWPRLLKQEEKMPWLNYNLNMLNVEEMEKILSHQFLERILHTNGAANKSNDDDDSEQSDDDDYCSNNFKTFTQIFNSEDMHDPMNAEII